MPHLAKSIKRQCVQTSCHASETIRKKTPTTMCQKLHTFRQSLHQLRINQPCNTHAQECPVRSDHPIEPPLLTLFDKIRPVVRSGPHQLPELLETLPCFMGAMPRQLFQSLEARMGSGRYCRYRGGSVLVNFAQEQDLRFGGHDEACGGVY